MAKHTFAMSDVTSDTRVLARSALGYDFNYYADDETIIFGTDSDATITWDGDSLNITSAATEHSGTFAVAGATSLATTALMSAGSGITSATGELVKHSVITVGNVIETTILIDLTGLNSNAVGDIIGDDGEANCHFGQITAAVNGTIFGGYMQCLETPTTGEPDIDIYTSTVATGTEDVAITHTDLATEAVILAAAADWTIAADVNIRPITGMPAADTYLYLTGGGGTTNGTYDAGKFLIKFYGY